MGITGILLLIGVICIIVGVAAIAISIVIKKMTKNKKTDYVVVDDIKNTTEKVVNIDKKIDEAIVKIDNSIKENNTSLNQRLDNLEKAGVIAESKPDSKKEK